MSGMSDGDGNGPTPSGAAAHRPDSHWPNGTVSTLEPAVADSVERVSLPDLDANPVTLQNGTSAALHLDPQDDSEAETVLSSPVKKREALKRVADKPVRETSRPHSSHVQTPDDPSSTASADPRLQQDHEAAAADMTDAKPSVDSTSPNTLPPTHDPNPRKRKFRESSSYSAKQSMSTALKHPRRESSSGPSEDGDSFPSPMPSSARPSSSSQNGHNSEKSETSNHLPDPSRKRRAVSQITTGSVKGTASIWGDSDDSSSQGDSHSQSATRPTRALNRSVSTPGRPPGRDHKRHVNRYGFTRLAEACETGDLVTIREWRHKDPVQLEQREFAGNTPLQIAALNGHSDTVKYLLDQGCNPHCANTDKDTPLIDAVENGHIDVVHILLDAGVNPTWQNMKGQQALDLIEDDTENGPEMRVILRNAIDAWKDQGDAERLSHLEEPTHRPGPKQGLHFMARTPDNLLKLVSDNDRNGVQEFLDARVPVDNSIVAAAAKTGDLYLVNMLLAEMTPRKARSKAEKPMLAVIGSSHYEMVKALTDLDQFDAVWRSKNHMTWSELAEHRQGPKWREEKDLLERLHREHVANGDLNPDQLTKQEPTAQKSSKLMNSLQEGSEFDTDGSASPNRARSKRRLMSKKDMRAGSRRQSRSTSPASLAYTKSEVRPAIDQEIVSPPKRKPGRPPKTLVRPATVEPGVTPPKRKVGRPRTKSLTMSQPAQPEIKRVRSASIKDRPVLFDSPSQSNAKPKRLKLDDVNGKGGEVTGKERKSVLQEKLKRETDQAEAAEKERLQQAEANRLAAEEEQARIAEDVAKLVALKQEDKRRRQEEAQRLELKRQEEAYIASLPSALRHVLNDRIMNPEAKAAYINQHFLPLQAVSRPAGGNAAAEHVLSYQVAGLVAGRLALVLLGQTGEKAQAEFSDQPISELDLSRSPDVSIAQRAAMLPTIGTDKLVHDFEGLQASIDREVAVSQSFDQERKILAGLRRMVQEDKAKFLVMAGLKWIPLSRVPGILTAVTNIDAAQDIVEQNGLDRHKDERKTSHAHLRLIPMESLQSRLADRIWLPAEGESQNGSIEDARNGNAMEHGVDDGSDASRSNDGSRVTRDGGGREVRARRKLEGQDSADGPATIKWEVAEVDMVID